MISQIYQMTYSMFLSCCFNFSINKKATSCYYSEFKMNWCWALIQKLWFCFFIILRINIHYLQNTSRLEGHWKYNDRSVFLYSNFAAAPTAIQQHLLTIQRIYSPIECSEFTSRWNPFLSNTNTGLIYKDLWINFLSTGCISQSCVELLSCP